MEDGSATNGGGLYDVTVEDGGSAAPTEEEVSELRSHVESLSKELKHSKSTVAALESQIEGYEKDRAEAAARIEQLQGAATAMGAVAARASELEGDVSRLQHDLVAALSEGEENAAEVAGLKKAVEGLEAEKSALKAAVDVLEARASGLVSEKAKAEAEVARKDERIRELEASAKRIEEKGRKREEEREAEVKGLLGKLETLLRDVDAKEAQLAQAKKVAADALLEVDHLRFSLEDRAVKEDAGMIFGEDGGKRGLVDWKSPVVMAAVPTATAVIVGAAICYLHYARRR